MPDTDTKETRERLLDAAEKVFAAGGFSPSLREITGEAEANLAARPNAEAWMMLAASGVLLVLCALSERLGRRVGITLILIAAFRWGLDIISAN